MKSLAEHYPNSLVVNLYQVDFIMSKPEIKESKFKLSVVLLEFAFKLLVQNLIITNLMCFQINY